MDISRRELTDRERSLVDEAMTMLLNHPRLGEIAVVAGAILADDSTHFSVDVRSRMAWTCAEPGLVARILTEDLPPIASIVAVCRHEHGHPCVISPCGSCREMLFRWAPDGWAIVTEPSGSVRAVRTRDLFPFYELWPASDDETSPSDGGDR